MLFVAASFLVGCGNFSNAVVKSASAEASSVESSSVVERSEAESFAQTSSMAEESSNKDTADLLRGANPDTAWRKAYIDYLEKGNGTVVFSEYSSMFTYTLVYVDDDDIPELLIDTGSALGGELIATFYCGKVIEEHLSRIGSEYIEKGGLIYTDTGHMDYYPVTITKLENGTFSVIGSGLASISDEEAKKRSEDPHYEYELSFEWEGRPVTVEEYRAEIGKLYDMDRSKSPNNYYSYDEFLYLLKNGKWFSYDHKYEFIKQDVTWDEAQEICKRKGGYLATITCLGEDKRISSLMKEQGFDDCSMYVGFRSNEWIGKQFYSFRWIKPDGSFVNIMPSMYDFWDYHWPGYDYRNMEWSFEKGELNCGLAKYNKETEMIYIFEAPDELIKVSPHYAGKMGFICEYDQ